MTTTLTSPAPLPNVGQGRRVEPGMPRRSNASPTDAATVGARGRGVSPSRQGADKNGFALSGRDPGTSGGSAGATRPVNRSGRLADATLRLSGGRRSSQRACGIEKVRVSTKSRRPPAGVRMRRRLRAVLRRVTHVGYKGLTLEDAMPRERTTLALCADIDGFSLHGAVRCDADDRKGLEQPCRYITRPALADKRVRCNSTRQGELELETQWRHGTTHSVMSPRWGCARAGRAQLSPEHPAQAASFRRLVRNSECR